MTTVRSGLSPGRKDHSNAHLARIRAWWSDWRICGTSGASTWEKLEELERDVTECLQESPPDVRKADRLTAEAMMRISGQWIT